MYTYVIVYTHIRFLSVYCIYIYTLYTCIHTNIRLTSPFFVFIHNGISKTKGTRLPLFS